MRKKLRVCDNREFSSIISKRKSIKSPAFVIYYAPKAQAHARIGISAGKKLGNAVIRTTVRRRLRAMIDQVFDFSEPYDFVILIRKPFLEQSFQQSLDMLAGLHARLLSAGNEGRNTGRKSKTESGRKDGSTAERDS